MKLLQTGMILTASRLATSSTWRLNSRALARSRTQADTATVSQTVATRRPSSAIAPVMSQPWVRRLSTIQAPPLQQPISTLIQALFSDHTIKSVAVHGSNNHNISCILQQGIKADLYFHRVDLEKLREGKTLAEFKNALLADPSLKESVIYSNGHSDPAKDLVPALIFFKNPSFTNVDAFGSSPIRIHENMPYFYYIRGCSVKPIGVCQIDGTEMPIVPNAAPTRVEGQTLFFALLVNYGLLGSTLFALHIGLKMSK